MISIDPWGFAADLPAVRPATPRLSERTPRLAQRRFHIRNAVATLAALAALCVVPEAQAQWTVTRLQPTGAGGSGCDGVFGTQQCGGASLSGAIHGGYWNGTSGTWVDLHLAGLSHSQALATSGTQQAGFVTIDGGERAALWNGTAVSWTDLHPDAATSSKAMAISGSQQAGFVQASGVYRATVWTGTAASKVDLHPAGAAVSVAFAGNGSQQGGFAQLSGVFHAGIWSGSAASWTDLHPSGSEGSSVQAMAGSQQAGYAKFGGANHAGIWSGSAGSWVDLNPSGSTESQALATTGTQQAGFAKVGTAYHACVWSGTAGSWQDLAPFLPGSWGDSRASGIWTDGTRVYVSGVARNTSSGAYEAVLWTKNVSTGTVLAVTPPRGPLAGGTSVTITGTGFAAGCTVKVGGVVATGVIVSGTTSITAKTPASASGGAKDVTVTTAAGTWTLAGGFTYASAPTLDSVTPTAGPSSAGTAITLTGTNFIAGATTVTVGGVAATSVQVRSPTSLTARVPAGAAGAKDVIVTTGGGTAKRTAGFTYVAAPSLTSVTPLSGPMSGGTVMTLAGTNFVTGGTKVTVGGVPATSVTVTSATRLTAVVPAPTDKAWVKMTTTSGDITLELDMAKAPLSVANFLRYVNAGFYDGTIFHRVIDNFMIQGGGFGPTLAEKPTGLPIRNEASNGLHNLRGTIAMARTSDPDSASSQFFINVVDNTSLDPTAGSAGYAVFGKVIDGMAVADLIRKVQTGRRVGTSIDGLSVMADVPVDTVQVLSMQEIAAPPGATPASSGGSKDVTVLTAGGSATKVGGFGYAAQPTVTAVAPATGPVTGGTTITVTGTNFLTGATTVTVGGVAATSVVVSSATSLTAKTPASSTAVAKDVVVATAGGSATKAGGFTYYGVPTLSAVTPNAGPVGGGTLITLTGTNFASGVTTVTVGGVAATEVTVISATTLTARTPASATTGSKTVVVSSPGGTATRASAFTYMAAPTLASVSPVAGPLVGGTVITLTGTNFASGVTTVTVGGVSATSVAVASVTSLTAKVPASVVAGAKTVAVSTPGGSASRVDAFTHLAVPTIAAVTPAQGPVSGGTPITITGSGFFAAGTTVTVGGVAATAVLVTDAGTLTAVTPAASAVGGPRDVVVKTAGGTATRAAGFTYLASAVPTIVSVSPSSGPTAGGTELTITGTNFVVGATVSVGTAAATNVTVLSATVIKARTPASSVTGVARDVKVVTKGGTATKAAAFTYVAAFTGGDPGGMPALGAPRDAGGPANTAPSAGEAATPVTMERCLELIQRSGSTSVECGGLVCGAWPLAGLDPVLEGPDGPDLDGNAVPDLCQLRCGDLDMSGRLDDGDVAMLLSMFGEAPVLGIGDLDDDGVIGEDDLGLLLRRVQAPAGSAAGAD